MFSISHPEDGTFRLEIHASPSDLERTDARRLRSVLLGLARELEGANEDDPEEPPDHGSGARRHLPARRRAGPLQREAS